MTKLTASDVKFWSISAATILLASAGTAALWPLSLHAAHAESDRLISEAAHAPGGEAQVDYRLAVKLHPTNHAARLGLARTQLANGHAGQALHQLDQAGEGSEVQILKIHTLLELGRYSDAVAQVPALTKPPADDANLTLAALTYALADRPQDAQALVPLLSSPEAAQRVQRALADKTRLAAELYATGLPESSSVLLIKSPPAPLRNYLLARIHFDRHTAAGLTHAADLLTAALALNPADLETRKLLLRVYQDQQNTAAASQQTALLAKLQSGRP